MMHTSTLDEIVSTIHFIENEYFEDVDEMKERVESFLNQNFK